MAKRKKEPAKDVSNLPSWAIQRHQEGERVRVSLIWKHSLVEGTVTRVKKNNLGRYHYRVKFDRPVLREIRRLFRGGHSEFVRFEEVAEVWAINEDLRPLEPGASM